MAGARAIGAQRSMLGIERAVEQQPINASVIVKIFNVAERAGRATHMSVQLRRAVCR